MPSPPIDPQPDLPTPKRRGGRHRRPISQRREEKPPLPANDAFIEERQARCFELAVQGVSNRAIAGLVGISRETVAMDITAEAIRRSEERKATREAIVEKSVSRYEKIFNDAVMRALKLTQTLDAKDMNWQERLGNRTAIERAFATALRAQKQSEEVQGLLVAPALNITATTNITNVTTGPSPMDLFRALPADERARILAKTRERLAMKNVTPERESDASSE